MGEFKEWQPGHVAVGGNRCKNQAHSGTAGGRKKPGDGKKLVGEMTQYNERLRQAGLSGRINTAFVERISLTIRQCVSKLTRRTWGPAKSTPELMEHLEWWRSYYHFVRPHESLAEELAKPIKREGKQHPRKYRKRTPAMLAGLTDRRWTVKDLLLYPLP